MERSNFWSARLWEESGKKDKLLELACGIIATVGDWQRESKNWQDTAARWCESYFDSLLQISKESSRQPNVNTAVEANADNKERLISEVRKPLVEALQSAREIIYSTRAASSRYHLVPGNVAWEIHKKYSREIKVIDALLAQYK